MAIPVIVMTQRPNTKRNPIARVLKFFTPKRFKDKTKYDRKSYGEIWKLSKERISASNPGEATLFVSELGFTNDIVFDKFGRMLVTDSQNGVIWSIDMETKGVTQFGNQLQSRNPDIPFGANGMAIDTDGTIYFSNTGNGVIHKIETRKEDGGLMSITVWRSHEALVGIDGLAIDKAGNVWAAINGKNAIFAITKEDRRIIEVAKSDNSGPLEFPSSIAFSGESIFIVNFDAPVGENKNNCETGYNTLFLKWTSPQSILIKQF